GSKKYCRVPKCEGTGLASHLVPLPLFGKLPSVVGSLPNASLHACRAIPICFRLFCELALAAASRTFWTAGRSKPTSTAMIAITTSNSMSVKPRQRFDKERYRGMHEPPVIGQK